MATLVLSDKDKFLLNMEGQDFSYEAKSFIKLRERGSERLKNQAFPTKKNGGLEVYILKRHCKE
jgi:hypothetical protein